MFVFRYKYFVGSLFAALVILLFLYLKLFWEAKPIFNHYITEADWIYLHKQEIFLRRENHVTKMCRLDPLREGLSEDEDYEMLAQNPHLLRNVLVNDEHKVLYCYVPKVACTNWKKVLYMLIAKNVTDLKDIPSDSVHRKNVFLKLSDLQGDDIVLRLQTYRKFLFVRHPVERVVSAYRNKFVMNYSSSAYFKKRFGVAILKKYRPREEISPKGDGVKFSEFVEYMVQTFDRNPKNLNEHWAPTTQLCHPCAVRYNLIGKYESLKEDAEYILEAIDAPHHVKFPPTIQSKTPMLVESYVSSLTEDQLEGLMMVYDKDFKLFDYHYRRKD